VRRMAKRVSFAVVVDMIEASPDVTLNAHSYSTRGRRPSLIFVRTRIAAGRAWRTVSRREARVCYELNNMNPVTLPVRHVKPVAPKIVGSAFLNRREEAAPSGSSHPECFEADYNSIIAAEPA